MHRFLCTGPTYSSALQRRSYDNNKPPYCHGNNCTIAKATAAECYNKQKKTFMHFQSHYFTRLMQTPVSFVCVCVLCVHQSVKGLGQRPRSFTKHGHITETQWKFPRATTAHFHGVDVAAQLHSCTGWKSPPACRVHTGETHLRDTKTHCLSSPNSTQLPSHYRAREVCAVFVGVSAVFIERLVLQESHGLSSVFTVCQLCL